MRIIWKLMYFGWVESERSDGPGHTLGSCILNHNARLVLELSSLHVEHRRVVGRNNRVTLTGAISLGGEDSPFLVYGVVGLTHVALGALLSIGMIGNLNSTS